ncbi:uncharacterized protein LOC143738592 [Siphateles boraxobius]|uniref:uncharacterized protein LOC143738592 n=1 Tax=Siphateles boraxobius TaxID=180520 RepID=UPI00406475DB
MTARVYCSFSAVLLCLSACLSTTDAGVVVSGQCPATLTVEPSRSGCTSDSDCFGGHKCCKFPCGPVCVPPVFTKPGECPSTNFGAGLCAELCCYDSDCPNNEKCCSNGCGHQCMAPFADLPAELIVRLQVERMTARVYCSFSAVLLCLSACLSTTDAGVVVSGQCPATLTVEPSRRGCTSDSDCFGGHKCCKFPCGPVCVPPVFTKPGECPSTNFGAGLCAELCCYDSDCPNNEKCCSNGCGHQCMAPFAGLTNSAYLPAELIVRLQVERMTARVYCSFSAVLLCLSACLSTTDAGVVVSGQCPATLTVEPSCRGCTSDSDCFGGHKCCKFPCGPVCVPPVFTKPGECPSTNFGAGLCAELCGYDSDCPNNEKCCSNGCGHQCMAPFADLCQPPVEIHFLESLGVGSDVKCLLCLKELTYSNNTSSMLRHYRALHEHAQTTNNPHSSQNSKKEMVNEALVNMVIKDSQPFSIVDDDGFRELLHVLDPTYVIPTRKALKVMVDHKYKEAKEKAREQLQNVQAISLTSDMWTSLNMDAYLAVTCHFIDNDKLCTILLGVQHFPKSHTAENLATGHIKLMEEWGIKDKVKCLVTDAAANMIACVRSLNVRHAVCIAHALNLIVGKSFDDISSFNDIRTKCRKLVTYFRTSTTAKERLAQVQEQMGRPVLKMIIEVETRWNSTYNMLGRLYQLREPVGAALASLKTDITPPTALEYEAVQDALHVLAPFRQATVELSGEKRVSASKVIPLMKMLNHAVTSKLEGLKSNPARQLGDSLVRRDVVSVMCLYNSKARRVSKHKFWTMCAEMCCYDSDCPNNEKCCSNGCGHQCMAPFAVKPAAEPPKPPGREPPKPPGRPGAEPPKPPGWSGAEPPKPPGWPGAEPPKPPGWPGAEPLKPPGYQFDLLG